MSSGSMPFSDCLASRIAWPFLAAISAASVAAAGRGDDRVHGAEFGQPGCLDVLAGIDHVPEELLRYEPGQVRRGSEGAPVKLGQPEPGVIGADHDVGTARQADPAAQAE